MQVIVDALEGYREDLRSAFRKMAEAEERHRQEMAEADRRHREAMTEVTGQLKEAQTTIVRLEGMIDVLTGRRQGPPDPPQPRPGL